MGYALVATKTVSGNTPKTRSLIEKAGQTFFQGVPVMVEQATGSIIEWDGATVAAGIAGVSAQAGSNLASTGAGAPAPFAPYSGLGSGLSWGNVQNQPSAKNIARGGPFVDGRCPFFEANEDTTFEAAVLSSQTTVVTDVTKNYGMTKDADGLWYVDRTKTGGTAVCKIVALHPNDGPKLGGRVQIKFLGTAAQASN
jgi:hypothetical protein